MVYQEDKVIAMIPRSVISLHPPWTTVFQGEKVNLLCNEFNLNAAEKTIWFHWYLGKEIQRETTGNTLKVYDSGEYRCQTPGSLPSNYVNLHFSPGLFILQAPQAVFEGDMMSLRCQKRRGKEKLTAVQYIWNKKVIFSSNKSLDLVIPQASLNHSGSYQCIGTLDKTLKYRSNKNVIHIKELFPRPQLKATNPQPMEGSSVTLSCETQLPRERQGTPLHFIFFRDDRVILSNWSRSPEFQITGIWREDSGVYWCIAAMETGSVRKHSLPLQMHVQRVPVSGVVLQIQPPGGQALEGQPLVLVCSVVEGTGCTTFSWHRAGIHQILGRKSERSQRAELEIPIVGESHTGGYYCTTDNGQGPIQSKVLNITVRGTPWKGGFIPAGTSLGLLIFLLLALALLFYCWHQRKSGNGFLGEISRIPPSPVYEEPPHHVCLDPVGLKLLYGNVNPNGEDLAYSEVQIVQLRDEREGRSTPPEEACFTSTVVNFGTSLEDLHPSVVYSEVKTQPPDGSSGKSFVLELFPPPVVTISPAQPTEGSPMILRCETSLPPWKSHVQLLFCFFKNKWNMKSEWSSSPEIQIIAVWSKSPLYYWCEAHREAFSISKMSQKYYIQVQRIFATVEINTRLDLKLVSEGQSSSVQSVEAQSLSTTTVPVSISVFTLRTPGAQTLEGSVVTLDCQVQKGSLPIHYQFFQEGILLKNLEVSWSRISTFSFPVTAEHSGSYYCSADNGLGSQLSKAWHLSITVPVTTPILMVRTPRTQTLEGDVVTLNCQTQRGLPPIHYHFYHEGVTLWSTSILSGEGATFTFSLTTEHSGNYYCTANNGFGIQHSETVSLSVAVPVSQPALTFRAPGSQDVVGDRVELHCEAQRGSPPILYWFYHENVTLGSSSAPSGGGVSIKVSLTAEHSGNYSCKAENSVGTQHSDRIILSVTGDVIYTEICKGPVKNKHAVTLGPDWSPGSLSFISTDPELYTGSTVAIDQQADLGVGYTDLSFWGIIPL
ncbi:titin-like [Erinaceus europaeus]|uniref:Titin-like n=1 Tax=Erinaceus europaeus TaxID=9365 RepID=A0ABM3YB92_ERIEU|nr:titin-like [Erinaceus europaeus]